MDYWNYLGWDDPHSQDFATDRQKRYSQAFKRRGVYTPQAVVNGSSHFVGSKSSALSKAVKGGLEKKAGNIGTLSGKKIDSQTVQVSYKLEPSHANLELVVVEYLNNTDNYVPRGENSGSTLSHTNVVQKLKKFGLDSSGSGVVKYQLTKSPKDSTTGSNGLLVFLQDSKTMEIHLAKSLT